MKTDLAHRYWVAASAAIVVLSGAWYWAELQSARGAMHGHSGGHGSGLVFGFVGMAFILFAVLKAPFRRFGLLKGSAGFWLRGHLYLGALSLPMVCLHAGFSHGGVLTSALMWILYLMVLSGLLGTLLQRAIPAALEREMPDEQSLEQIPARLEGLAQDAAGVARGVSGVRAEFFEELYQRSVLPYLAGQGELGVMSNRTRAGQVFSRYRLLLPDEMHAKIVELEAICDQARRLRGQQRMHSWLRGWLLVHVPLSGALVVLIVVHSLQAIRY